MLLKERRTEEALTDGVCWGPLCGGKEGRGEEVVNKIFLFIMY